MTLQDQIHLLSSNGSVPGEPGQYMGGVVEVPAGVTRLKTALYLRSGVHLRGQGAAASVIECDRGVLEQTDANSVGISTGNGPFRATVEGVTLRSARGGGWRLAPGLRGEPDVIRFKDVIFDTAGVGIDLTGLADPSHVTYRLDLDGVDFRKPGAACVRGPVRLATIDCRVLGDWRGGTVPPALIDLYGDACTVNIKRAWLEGEYPEGCPMLRVTGGGPGFEAKVIIGDMWNEPHGVAVGSAQMHFDRALVTSGFLNVIEGFPLKLTRGSKLDASYLRCTDAAGGALPVSQYARTIRVDDTSVVYERGRRVVAGQAVPVE